uniref:Uncharacterized protein n=1 Tax=Anguilla anguilla TaxID=7936 RepID=A0A0E9TU55_ANGAN
MDVCTNIYNDNIGSTVHRMTLMKAFCSPKNLVNKHNKGEPECATF